MLEMSTTKTTCLIAHRNNTCKVPLVSSLFLVPCGFIARNTNYLRPLLQVLSIESSKNSFLLSDFNIGLLKFNSCSSTCNFLDELSSSYFILQIFLPSRITKSIEKLTDNIFCNIPQPSEQNTSANLTTTYSNDLLQVLLVPRFYRYKNVRKSNLFIRDWKTCNNATFTADYKSTYWPTIIKNDEGNPNLSFRTTLKKLKRWYQITLL